MANSIKPIFSIVIPTFNRSDLLERTIRSLQDQTVNDFEAIIVDDGSVDDTEEVVKSIADVDGRVKYIRQTNQGRSAARNNGVEHSEGEWLMFLDSDDLLTTDALEILLELSKDNPEVDIIAGKITLIDIDDADLDIGNPKPNEDDHLGLLEEPYLPLIREFYPSMGSYVVRSEIVKSRGGFITELEPCEDFDFCLRMAIGNRMIRADRTIAKIRQHGGNTPLARFHVAGIEVATRHLKLISQLIDERRRKLAKSEWFNNIGDDYLGQGSRTKALSYYAKAAMLTPSKLLKREFLRRLLAGSVPDRLKIIRGIR